jgi:hypothetical protein
VLRQAWDLIEVLEALIEVPFVMVVAMRLCIGGSGAELCFH